MRTSSALLLLPALALADILPSVPLDDPDADLMLRLEGTGGCSLPSRRPWPGESVLACTDSLLASPDLGASDRGRVLSMRHRLFPSDSGWGLVSWKERERRLRLDVGTTVYGWANRERTGAGVARLDTIGRDVVGGMRVRPLVEVLLGPDIALWSRPLQITDLSPDRRYAKETNARDGVYQTALFAPVGESSRGRTTDWLEGAIEVQGMFGRFATGLQPVLWGDLPVEPLMFSGRTSAFPMAQWVQSVGPIEASVLYGKPIGGTWEEDRELYAHRIAWSTPTLSVGFSEAVVSADRGLQPIYLVPVFPYIMAEHLLGDPDNKQADLDASWRVHPGLEVSAELFLDDLQNAFGFLSDGWGNKWGLGIGVRASGWTGSGSLDRIQASRMEPWAGTASAAVVPGKPSNAPIDFGVPLGWALGPNSAQLDWIHRQDVSEVWSWSASVRAQWKGTDSGSDVHDLNFRDSSGTWVTAHSRKVWLDGAVIDRQDLSIGAERRFPPWWRLSAGIGVARRSVPGRDVRWIPSLSAGVSWNE